MNNSLVKTSNLSVGYGNKIVVDNIEIELCKGKIITLIGPNGAGKSTILKTICGQLKALNGDVYIQNQRINNIQKSDLAQNMAVLFTTDVIKEQVSCFDVVALGRYPYTGILGKLSEKDVQVVEETMKSTSVYDLRDTQFDELSDGQRQRVLLARALCQEPKILLLDEPTTFLDVKYRLEFLSLILKQARENGLAIIMSLHELDMARQISDEILCIKDNLVVKKGSPDEVFKTGYINELFDIKMGSYDEKNYRALLNL